MTDVFNKEKRSEVMSAIRSKGNKSTEIALIKIFKQNKIKNWRRNVKLEGKPDFVFAKQRLIVFVDGCYWHGHDCRKRRPGQNYKYWKEKIEKNKIRDINVTKSLRVQGWRVIRIWECEIEKSRYAKKIKKIIAYVDS